MAKRSPGTSPVGGTTTKGAFRCLTSNTLEQLHVSKYLLD